MNKIGCVVLPTYNEAKNVRVVIPRIFEQAIKILNHDLHVLVVDDNTPDGTAAVGRELLGTFPNLHVLTGEKRGLGESKLSFRDQIEFLLNLFRLRFRRPTV